MKGPFNMSIYLAKVSSSKMNQVVLRSVSRSLTGVCSRGLTLQLSKKCTNKYSGIHGSPFFPKKFWNCFLIRLTIFTYQPPLKNTDCFIFRYVHVRSDHKKVLDNDWLGAHDSNRYVVGLTFFAVFDPDAI